MKKIIKHDEQGNTIYLRDTNGVRSWMEYDENNNLIHYRDSLGRERWYDEKGNQYTTLV